MANILIIDDDAQFRTMVRQLLEEEGHHIYETCDGREALRIYREHEVELSIIDILMPNKDGLETILELKRYFPKPQIIAMSGGGRGGQQTYLEHAKIFGAEIILNKPFDPPELFEAIDRMLEERVG